MSQQSNNKPVNPYVKGKGPPLPKAPAPAQAQPPPQQPAPKRQKSSVALHLEMRDLTKAANTTDRQDSALNLLCAFRREMGLPEVPTKIEYEVDNLRDFIVRMCNWVETRPIPIFFDRDLKPTTNTKRCCKETTLAGYMGQILQWLRRQLPDHEEFADLDPKDDKAAPEWWTYLRKSFIENCIKFQNVQGGDFTFGTEDIRPLYRDLGCGYEGDENPDYEWDKDEHPMSHCDLKAIMINLLKKANKQNGNLEMAAMIIATSRGVGRGGEVKFQNYNDWNFDFFMKLLDTKWRESKNSTLYASPRVPDDEFPFDFFLFHGAFGLENAFVRTTEQVRDGQERHVYPSLHGIRNDSVSSKVTKAIRDNLPAHVPKEIVAKYSAKSLRSGAINELSMHRDIGVFEASALSGHSVGNNINSYLDESNPLRALPAAQSLSVGTTEQMIMIA